MMKTFLQSRKVRGLIILSVLVLVGYAVFTPEAVLPVTKNVDTPLFGNSSDQEHRNASGLGMFAWGGVEVRKSDYANLDPKQFALKETAYGGHPAYSKAMYYKVCADYFEASKDTAQDLEDQRRSDPSGKSEDFARWQLTIKEQQCKNVSKADLQKIDALMHEAAKAGDISAQSYELNKTAASLIAVYRAKLKENPDQIPFVGEEEKNLLGSATALAEKGDKEAAFLAARLTATDRFGQKDVTTSAAWALVGIQQKGELFSASNRVFEDEPYSALATEQRQVAAQRAQEIYNRCCYKR
ncbi:hypothetical protein [Undibacterium sp. RuTC16W]|uniref:hypothetical protein n=1 Tax=Undibacterium sp. RuTC16W TaxID=3413048 RepID=UPI003BF276FB